MTTKAVASKQLLYSLWATFMVLATGISANGMPCPQNDKSCLLKLMRSHKSRDYSFYQNNLNLPIHERVFAAPPEIVDYIRLNNRRLGISSVPKIPKNHASLMEAASRVLKALPEVVKSKVSKKLAGIYFVKDLGGTGYADYIWKGRRRVAGYVVLDYSILAQKTSNQWATWRDSTPFKGGDFSISIKLVDKSKDSLQSAVNFILLHELGHIASIGNMIHPPWDVPTHYVSNIGDFEFFNLSWKVTPGVGHKSKYDDDFFLKRKKIAYYFGPELLNGSLPEFYEHLEKTNFVSLYAATRPSDDWAESFALYVHSILEKKPFEIRISKDGKLYKSIGSCFTSSRCKDKKEFLDKFFGAL